MQKIAQSAPILFIISEIPSISPMFLTNMYIVNTSQDRHPEEEKNKAYLGMYFTVTTLSYSPEPR
jgi:hypothetical protein